TDGRFSGATRGFMVGHVAPEAAVGGPIAAIRDGDPIVIDLDRRQIDVDLPPEAVRDRLAAWQKRAPSYATGVFAKYVQLVTSASEGAVTGPA
ncbi:MAG: dihydroxy-acid dehydratase, partial [Bryobacteraceae bacterium]